MDASQRFYQVRFLPMDLTITVDREDREPSHGGEKGSILDIALKSKIDLDHSCGGVCACSTCHVVVTEGLQSLNSASENEEDMLDLAPGLTPTSRLACQAIPDGSSSITVKIPGWNRNLVRERH